MSDEKRFNRLGDIAVEVIGPALIMLLVGSLAFFLLEVAYGGDHVQVLKWKFGLFTFAAVLISRISIQIGFERAAVYGGALALAILIVSSRYISVYGAVPILALVWWSAGRLTWDCTFISDTRDCSAQGIVDLVKNKFRKFVGRFTTDEQASNAEAMVEATPVVDYGSRVHSGVPTGEVPAGEVTPSEEAPHRKLLNFLFGRRQPNRPGLWVFYFVLAGFPIFGIGQGLIHPDNPLGRKYAAMYFGAYMISALTLLMMTSLLGLSRYLKKRQAQMNMNVARSWIILGLILAIGILAFTFWLPRPTNNLSLAGWIPRLSSRHREPQDNFFSQKGSERSKKEPTIKQGADSRNSQQQDSGQSKQSNGGGQSQQKKSGNSSQSNDKNGGKSNDSGGKQQGGDHKSGKEDGKGKSGKSGGKKSGKSTGQKKKSNAAHKSNQGKQDGKKQEGQKSKNSSGKQDQKNNDKNKSDSSKQKSSNSQQKKFQPKNANQRRQEQYGKQLQSSKQLKDRQAEQAKKNPQKNQGRKNSGRQNSRSDSNQQKTHPKQSPNRTPDSKSTPQSSNFAAMLGTFVQFVFWLILLIVSLFFAVKYRKEIVAAWKNFLEEFKSFWERLFGRKSNEETESAAAIHKRDARTIRFSEFGDPFLAGQVEQWDPEQVVEYSFRAMEAWGRDNTCPREPEQTPHEFAAEISALVPKMKRDASRLADLYCQIAYAPGTITRDDIAQLKRLWELMRTTSVAPQVNPLAPAL